MPASSAASFESILPRIGVGQALDKEATEETKMQMLRFTQHDKGLANNMVILRSEVSNL